MNNVFFILGAICISLSALIFIMEIYGVFKFKFILNRMHAAAMGDSSGLFLVSLGCILINGFSLGTLKIILTVLFFWLTSPVCANLVARLRIETNDDAGKHYTEVKEAE